MLLGLLRLNKRNLEILDTNVKSTKKCAIGYRQSENSRLQEVKLNLIHL